MTNWENPQDGILSAASITSTPTLGPVVDHKRIVDAHALSVAVSGFSGSGALFVILQGSLDNVVWYTLIAAEYETGGYVSGSPYQVSTDTPAQYTQVYAYTTAGTSGTVTASAVEGTTKD